MKVRLINITPDAENTMVYCARVSSPQNQENIETGPKLLKYCFDNGHWSVFEMADMTVEIETSIAVSRQILRHKSFSFQEFSQRYADASQLGFEDVQFRKQDVKNRQNSTDELTDFSKNLYADVTADVIKHVMEVYNYMLDHGVAKESARMILPMCTTTRLYVKGSIRSWITYLKVRTHESTQLEHREVASAIKGILVEQLPVIGGLI